MKRTLPIVLLSVFFFPGNSAQAQDIEAGKEKFNAVCTQCHAVNRKVIGPALSKIYERRDEAWIIKFVKNSQELIQAGDEYSVNLFNQYNKTVMPPQPVSDAEIKNILAYIKSEDEAQATAAVSAGGADGATGTKESGNNTGLLIGLGALCVLLLIIAFALEKVIGLLERMVRLKQGATEKDLEAEEKAKTEARQARVKNFKKFALNKYTVLFGNLILVGIIAIWGWGKLWTVGVQQGYAPEQPIKFSHELHAGINDIQCIYCHSGADESRHAGIPSLNVCMNCHKYIQEGPEHGTKEIAKIYEHLDYDPNTQQFGPKGKPIEWVRVHNLPDFVYFNHSQHVKVAGIECQTCHGPVEKMKVLEQSAPLTMGWCITCHRERKVDFKDNDYYDKIVEAHKALDQGADITVAKLGGIECARCHY